MNRIGIALSTLGVCLMAAIGVYGQTQRPIRPEAIDETSTVPRRVESALPVSGSATSNSLPAVVPRLMKFSGVLHDAAGKPLTGTVEITFSLYSTEGEGDALWFETQSVQADELGRYTALLGAMHADGLPIDLFTSGEVRWLGIQGVTNRSNSRACCW